MRFFNKYYKYTLLLLALNGLLACKSPEEKIIPPKGLISEHEMGRILADILLIQNHISSTVSPNYLSLELSSFSLIDEKYQLSDSQAYRSYQYYLSEPEKYHRILEISKDTLEQIRKKITTTTED